MTGERWQVDEPVTPDVADVIRSVLEAVDGVTAWNAQLVVVAEVMRKATEQGRGVIIRMSKQANTIDAEPSTAVPVGSGVLIDRDQADPVPSAPAPLTLGLEWQQHDDADLRPYLARLHAEAMAAAVVHRVPTTFVRVPGGL